MKLLSIYETKGDKKYHNLVLSFDNSGKVENIRVFPVFLSDLRKLFAVAEDVDVLPGNNKNLNA